MIESVNFSIMQHIMLLHVNTAFLFWASEGEHFGILFHVACIFLYVCLLLILNFNDTTSEIYNTLCVPTRTNLSDVYGVENYLYRF